ncbi:MAG: hypothetical protein U0836_17135 [Pirellulales bacterium]
MKNSLPALVLGFVSLAWGEESLRAQPVRTPTELPPASEPPPPQPAEASWSLAASQLATIPALAQPTRVSPQARLAGKLVELERLQHEIEALRVQIEGNLSAVG